MYCLELEDLLNVSKNSWSRVRGPVVAPVISSSQQNPPGALGGSMLPFSTEEMFQVHQSVGASQITASPFSLWVKGYFMKKRNNLKCVLTHNSSSGWSFHKNELPVKTKFHSQIWKTHCVLKIHKKEKFYYDF